MAAPEEDVEFVRRYRERTHGLLPEPTEAQKAQAEKARVFKRQEQREWAQIRDRMPAAWGALMNAHKLIPRVGTASEQALQLAGTRAVADYVLEQVQGFETEDVDDA